VGSSVDIIAAEALVAFPARASAGLILTPIIDILLSVNVTLLEGYS